MFDNAVYEADGKKGSGDTKKGNGSGDREATKAHEMEAIAILRLAYTSYSVCVSLPQPPSPSVGPQLLTMSKWSTALTVEQLTMEPLTVEPLMAISQLWMNMNACLNSLSSMET